MAISVHMPGLRRQAWRAGRPAATPAFEWAVVGGGLWMMLGAFLDAWAHQHFRIESFFNPFHAVLYSGMSAAAAVLLVGALLNVLAGYRWDRSLPEGYGLSLLAVAGFGVAGTCDLAWHQAFGFDGGFAGGVSPPHLALGTCGLLAGVGPLRAAWRRPGRRAPWTAVVSAGFVLFLLSDLTQWANPLNDPYPVAAGPAGTAYGAQALGLASFLIQGGLGVGLLLYLLRRFQLPPGAALLLLGSTGGCMAALKDHEPLAIAGALGGAAAEVLLAWLRPTPRRLAAVRAFAFLVPVVTAAAFFAAVATLGQIWWTLPLTGGAIGLAGMAGVLVSFLAFPPDVP